MNHECNERCSHRATPESLTALGFPVKLTKKGCFGSIDTVREGTTFERARHEATNAGLLRLCTKTERSTR